MDNHDKQRRRYKTWWKQQPFKLYKILKVTLIITYNEPSGKYSEVRI